MIQDNLVRKSNVSATVGFTTDCDFVCDGTADNIQVQAAVDGIAAKGGGIVYVRGGNYTFNCSVDPKSNVEINMSANTVIKMDDQQIWTLPEPTIANSNTVKVSDEILSYIQEGQMVGFTDGTPGYIYDNGTTRHADCVTEIDKDAKTITLLFGMPDSTFTTMVTIDCAFYHSDQMGTSNNFIIRGGIIDGNVEHQTVWMHDMGQNGILIGTVGGNILIENVEVKNFFFQGIHPMPHSHSRENRAGITTTIRGCYIHHTGFSAICVDSSGLVAVENCIAHDCMCAVQAVDVNKIYINNCCGTDCTTAGIMINGNPYLSPLTDLDNYIRIENCVLINSINGIFLQNIKDSIISNSIITNNQETGVKLQSNCSRISLNGLTLINNGVGISEANDCSDNIANSILFNSNTKDYNISSMKIGDNPSDINLSRHTDSIIYAKNSNGEVTGGIISDPSLVDTDFILIDTVAMKDHWEVHHGYAIAKHLTGLKPNTQYTMWTDGQLPEGSPNGALYFDLLNYPVERDGYKTATTDENGEIWMWVTAYDSYPNYPKYFDGTYKVTLAEGTTPQPYVDTTPVMYTSKPSSSNKVVCQSELTSAIQSAITNAIGGSY